MIRGRKRKHDPTMPRHIDQTKLPLGIYWQKSGQGRWFVFTPDPEGGPSRAKTVAGPRARLSDLHAIVEQLAGGDVRGTMAMSAPSLKTARNSPRSRQTRAETTSTAPRSHESSRLTEGKGPTLDKLYVDRLTLPAIQAVIETIAKGRPESAPGAADPVLARPSKANHLLRYFRVLFGWGMRHGHCKTNPAQGTKQVRERKRHGMPALDVYEAVLSFARKRGAVLAHTKGSSPPYLWPLLEIKYLCRMRSIEVVKLTDAHASEQGLYISRAKGSNDNIVKWTPRLKAAWDAALAVRAQTLARPSNKGRPIPIRPEQRFVFLSESGTPLTRAGLDNAWQDLIHAAMDAEVIAREQRFTLHGLKHRGITDTKGKKADKKEASGHKTEAMLERYDHEVAVVEPARPGEGGGAS
jgi:site-specific recombinase XerD